MGTPALPRPAELAKKGEPQLMQCLICMDEVTEARACGFCNKSICRTCLPHLVEINYEGEADEENGDLRCPNCRGSLVS